MSNELQKQQRDYQDAMRRIRSDNGQTTREDREVIDEYVQALERELARANKPKTPTFTTNPQQ